MPPCLTLRIITYGSRVNGVASSPTPWCSNYFKRKLRIALVYCQPIYKKIIYKNCRQKKTVLLPVKSSSDDDPGFRHGFGAEASLPLTQGASISQCYQTLSVQMQLQSCFGSFLYIPSSLLVKVRF